MDFRERYKRVGFGREDVDVNRVLRSQRRDEARHELRSEHFSLRRDLEASIHDDNHDSFLEPEPPTSSQSRKIEHSLKDQSKKTDEDLEVAVQQRLLELEKWQKERNRKKILEKKRLKPVFKVGVVHHRVYSPPLNKEAASVPHQKLCRSKEVKQEQLPPKRVTRATEKRLAAKAVTNQQRREDMRTKKKVPVTNKNEQQPKAPFAPTNYQFRAPVGVTPLPMFGRLASEDIKENMNLADASANVTSSTTEFGKNFSTLSDSVFLSNSESIKTSKITGRRSNSRRSNIHPCDSTTNKNSYPSSIEAIALKSICDNQEMSSDQEEVAFSKINLSLPKHMKSPAVKRKSTRKSIRKSSQSMTIDESKPAEEMMEVQESSDYNSDSVILNSKETRSKRVLRCGRRRSIKTILDESFTKSEDASFVLENQEMLDNQQNVDSDTKNASYTIDTSSVATEMISENFNNDIEKSVKKDAILESQKVLNNLEIIDSKLKTTILDSPALIKPPNSATKRSTRNLKSTSEEEKLDENLEVSAEKSSTVSKLNKSKSLGTRKSTRFAKSKSEEDTAETPIVQENSQSRNGNIMDFTTTRQTRKSVANRNKSAKILNIEDETVNSSVKEMATVDDQKMTIGRESVFDLENKHLLDVTLSELIKTKKRKTMKINNETPMDFQDQSLIKFSPRQSLRLQNDKTKQQASPIDITSTTKKSSKIKSIDESFIKFDPLIATSNEKLNESTSSEPMKQKSPNSQNDSQNFSLNLTLPDESPSEKPPAFYSPYIVTSRGKSNIRKEVQKRRFSQHIDEDIPTKDTIMQSLNISVEEEERTAQFYKYILDKEIERLNERCDTWNAIKESESTPEEIHYLIQAAVGHTQLLINKKFQRFRGLVLDCETGKGEMLVTCKDLQGFWDMMYMEIKDVDNRFNKLEELKANNWVEEADEKQEEPKPKKKAPLKKPAAKKKPTAKASSLRALIMAARKKMENKDSEMEVDVEVDVNKPIDNNVQETEKQKSDSTIKDARRFSRTPKNMRQSLVKTLQSSSGRKSVPSSPLIAMKISQMCKTPEVHMDESIIYINSDQTPAKSILKGKLKDDVNGSIAKSKNKVFFKEQPIKVQEFANDKDDYRSSNEFKEDEACKEPVERRLDFENDSFNESNVEEQGTPEEVELRRASSIYFYPSSESKKNPKHLQKKGYIVLSPSPYLSLLTLDVHKKKPRVKNHNSFDESTERSTRVLKSQAAIKELFLNKDGFICERSVPVTPKVINIKRTNSERVTRSTRNNKPEESNATSTTVTTPKPRRRTTQKSEAVMKDSPFPTDKLLKKNLLTPRSRKSLKRTTSELSESSEGTPVSGEPSPKVRKTPKTIKTLDSTSIGDGIERTATPRLRRTKSMNSANSKKDESETDVKTPTPRSGLRRNNSRTMANSKEDFDRTLTPGVTRSSLKVT